MAIWTAWLLLGKLPSSFCSPGWNYTDSLRETDEMKNEEGWTKITLKSLSKKIKGNIALTIDDGPTKYMLKMADELDESWHKAIFFVVWENTARYRRDVIEVLNRWHMIWNHSWSHPLFTRLSLDKAKEQIRKTDDIISDIISASTNSTWKKLFRYPYWWPVNKNIKNEFWQYLEDLWYIKNPIFWTVDTNDWKKTKTTEDIANSIMSANKWSIVLFHERQKSYQALQMVSKPLATKWLISNIKLA